jgi:membrane protease YdiL (CAAX protease family)
LVLWFPIPGFPIPGCKYHDLDTVGLALPRIGRLAGSIRTSPPPTIDGMTTTVQSPVSVETDIPQYSKARVLAIWAAAALPMGILAWVVAPAIAGDGPNFGQVLIGCLTAGLVWQFVLVLILNRGFNLRTLWLQRPSTPDGRRGGRLWLWAVPFVVGFGLLQLVRVHLPKVASHDFGSVLSTTAGHDLLRGNWGLFALIVVELVFNTVLGEELLFRGLLLPRMRGAFGRADWIVNGVLMGLYHLHQPWGIPTSVVAGLLMAYPTKRFRSAWMGIIVHSSQSVVLGVGVLTLVLR